MTEKNTRNLANHDFLFGDKKNFIPAFTNLLSLVAAVTSALNLSRQYPLMREFFLLFLLSESAFLCRLLIMQAKSANPKSTEYIRRCLAGWLILKGQQKLLLSRAVFLLVLIFLLTSKPDFFSANIIMFTGIVVFLMLWLMRVADIFKQSKTKIQESAKNTPVKHHKTDRKSTRLNSSHL